MHGVIAAGDIETAAAGAEILRQGGNAVDAAVAATFASFIAEAILVNIGGGGIAQVYNPATQRATVYDFFSNMPGLEGNGLPPNLDFREKIVDFGAFQQPFYIGRGSVAVPGVVAGLCRMLTELGTLPLSQVLAPAIHLARTGTVLSEQLAYAAKILVPIVTDTPGAAAIYAARGRVAQEGERIYFTEQADTLEALGREGADLYYQGAVAEAIVRDQAQHGGLITAADLGHYAVNEQAPLTVPYRGYEVLLPPPASQGGGLIAFALRLLNHFPLPSMKHHSVEHLQIMAEVMRLTNLARAEWDARQLKPVPPNRARGHEYLAELLADETIARYAAQLKDALRSRQADVISKKGPSNTTHLSVADSNGLLVSITTSAGESAGYIVDGTGMPINNMLGEMDLHPHGFHKLPPGQRLFTMMSPTLVTQNGKPVLAVGSGGSNRLRTAILQALINVIDFDMPLRQAVDAPRIHFEDGVAQLEGGIPAAAADALEAAGYTVNRWPGRNMFFGGAHAVAHTPSGDWIAAGDARRGGSVKIIYT